MALCQNRYRDRNRNRNFRKADPDADPDSDRTQGGRCSVSKGEFFENKRTSDNL
jgi:hypothetical protein